MLHRKIGFSRWPRILAAVAFIFVAHAAAAKHHEDDDDDKDKKDKTSICDKMKMKNDLVCTGQDSKMLGKFTLKLYCVPTDDDDYDMGAGQTLAANLYWEDSPHSWRFLGKQKKNESDGNEADSDSDSHAHRLKFVYLGTGNPHNAYIRIPVPGENGPDLTSLRQAKIKGGRGDAALFFTALDRTISCSPLPKPKDLCKNPDTGVDESLSSTITNVAKEEMGWALKAKIEGRADDDREDDDHEDDDRTQKCYNLGPVITQNMPGRVSRDAILKVDFFENRPSFTVAYRTIGMNPMEFNAIKNFDGTFNTIDGGDGTTSPIYNLRGCFLNDGSIRLVYNGPYGTPDHQTKPINAKPMKECPVDLPTKEPSKALPR